MIKVIATDMDGTFLDDKGSYDRERFERVLTLCEERGWIFTIASGRGLLALDKLFAPFRDRLAMVAENGSLVRYQEQLIFERHLTEQQCLAIIEALINNPYGQGFCFLLSGYQGAYILKQADSDYVRQEADYHENIRLVDTFEVIDDRIIKITARLTPDMMDQGTAWLQEHLPDVTVVTTGFEAIDIIVKGVDKGEGLKHLCQHIGVSSENAIAFGDNLNDFEMLCFAGQGIAVANARPEILEIADQIIGHHNEGAVLTYLEELVKTVD